MNVQGRIIDRDIEFYAAEVEFCTVQLQRCWTEKEPYWQKRKRNAKAVLQTLTDYRISVDKEN